jgi:hypothetical protein
LEKTIKHPTHFKLTSFIGGAFLLLSFISFGVGIYFQQKAQIELSHKFALSFLINTALLISWLVFRMKLCKCASCGGWLSELATEDKLKSRRFVSGLETPKGALLWQWSLMNWH